MRLSKKTAIEKAIDRISGLKGPNRARREGLVMLANAFANQDKSLRRRSLRIARQLQVSLQEALPDTSPQFIGDIVADLDSLWDTGRKLDSELKKLFQMRFPEDRDRLRDFLAFVEAVQIDMVGFWIGNLRKRIPGLRHALDRQERSNRRRERAKPSKKPGVRRTPLAG